MLYFYADLFMAIFTAYSSAAARLVASIPHRQSWSKNEILFLLIFQLARSDYLFCIFHTVTQMTPKKQHEA